MQVNGVYIPSAISEYGCIELDSSMSDLRGIIHSSDQIMVSMYLDGDSSKNLDKTPFAKIRRPMETWKSYKIWISYRYYRNNV